jgi:hypothetical protein
MWVSAYPWGWMPYRYGNWAFVSGYGWVWQPGYWNSWYSVPRVVNPPRRVSVPVPPVRTRTTVMVGRGLTVNPVTGFQKRLILTPGSAGIGVPRGTVRNLDRASREMTKINRSVTVATEPQGRIAPPSRPSHGNSGSGNPGSVGSGPRPTFPSSSPSVRTPSAPVRIPSPPARSSRPH